MKMWRVTYDYKSLGTPRYCHSAIKIQEDDENPIIIVGHSAGYEGEDGDHTDICDYAIWLRDHQVKDCVLMEKRVIATWVPETCLEE